MNARQLRRVAFALAVCLSVVAAPVVGLAGATAPQPPAAYYGAVTVNGSPAPAGLTVTARIDGEVRGTITTDANGTFGGPGAFEEKLAVNGTSADEGAEVNFTVAGEFAGSTTWHSGVHESLSLSVTDDTAPQVGASVAASPVPVGVAVEFSASARDEFGVASVEWAFDDGATAMGSTVVHAFDDPGRYQAVVTVTDRFGNVATDTVNVSISAAPAGGAPGQSPGGQPGGGAGGGQPQQSGGQSPQTDGPGTGAAPRVMVTGDGVNVTVVNLASNQSADVGIPNVPSSEANGVRVETLSVSATRSTNVSLAVRATGEAPTESGSAGDDAFSYLQVNHSTPDEAIGDVTFTFEVNASVVEAAGTTPERIVLYRFHDGAWQRLPTTVVGETDGGYRFRAVSPGLSVFAVRSGQPDVSVTDAAVATPEIAVGDAATINATLRNDGSGEGAVDLTVTFGGSTIATRSVTVGPGVTRTVSISVTPETAGDYAVAVSGVDAGTLAVTTPTTTPTTSTERSETTAGTPATNEPLQEIGGFPPAAFAALAFVLAAVFVLFALARRRV